MTQRRPSLEILEDRLAPAIALSVNGAGQLLLIRGTLDAEPGELVVDFVANDRAEIRENGIALGTLDVPGDLRITVGSTLQTSPSVLVDLNGFTLTGSVRITLGNAPDGFGVALSAIDGGTIEGDLTLTTGTGGDYAILANDLDVLGNVVVNMGLGEDSLILEDGIDVGRSVRLTNVNQLDVNTYGTVPVTIGGDLLVSNATERPFVNALDVGQSVQIAGSVNFTTGSSLVDDVRFGGTVQGDFTARLGNGYNQLTFLESAVIHGRVRVTGGNSKDSVNFLTGGQIGGSFMLALANGDNAVALQDGFTIAGPRFTYEGGNGVDSLELHGQAAATHLRATLGPDADSLLFGANLSLAKATIELLAGRDTLLQTNDSLSFPLVIQTPEPRQDQPKKKTQST